MSDWWKLAPFPRVHKYKKEKENNWDEMYIGHCVQHFCGWNKHDQNVFYKTFSSTVQQTLWSINGFAMTLQLGYIHVNMQSLLWICLQPSKKVVFFGRIVFFSFVIKKKNVWMRFCFHVWNREKKFFRIFFHVWNRVKRVLCVKTCQNSVSLETKLFLRLEAFHKHINSVLYHWKLRYLRTPPRMKTFRN